MSNLSSAPFNLQPVVHLEHYHHQVWKSKNNTQNYDLGQNKLQIIVEFEGVHFEAGASFLVGSLSVHEAITHFTVKTDVDVLVLRIV